MIITTTNQIQGYDIKEYYGLVIASQVAGTGFASDITASFSDFFGGNSGKYREQLNNLYIDVKKRLEEDALKMGANAIVGFGIDFDEISGKDKSMFMVTATGTAVKAEQNRYDLYKKLRDLHVFFKEGIINEEQFKYESMRLKDEYSDSKLEKETKEYFEKKALEEKEAAILEQKMIISAIWYRL